MILSPFLCIADPIDCSADKCHLAWLIKDNKDLLDGYANDGTCSNRTKFTELNSADYANCKNKSHN